MAIALNFLEVAECKVDLGSRSNLNFSVIAHYRGRLTTSIVKAGLEHWSYQHPLLRVALKVVDSVYHFIHLETFELPFREGLYDGENQWKREVQIELRDRFTQEDQPLWRACLLKGDEEGEMHVTFHHVIADGICAMPAMNHLFGIFANLLQGTSPAYTLFDDVIPPVESLFSLCTKEVEIDKAVPVRIERDFQMDFVKYELDMTITKKILVWSKEQGVKVHATLFAALLLAVRRVVKPDFENFQALTVINYRRFFTPPVPNEVMKLLRAGMITEVEVALEDDLASIARAIHDDVHSKLDSGEAIYPLKVMAERSSVEMSAQEVWKRALKPSNVIAVTNLGVLNFTGDYTGLVLDQLFFVADVRPFFEEANNFVLGAHTFKGKTMLTLWFLQELVEEVTANQILAHMQEILSIPN
ncbi:MAG: condensation domain-containing protein [Chlamydiales bacterium]|nr:condensation domain-containing protein [Chlamydiales bacterium]